MDDLFAIFPDLPWMRGPSMEERMADVRRRAAIARRGMAKKIKARRRIVEAMARDFERRRRFRRRR